jgi:hypothetical protein
MSTLPIKMWREEFLAVVLLPKDMPWLFPAIAPAV